MLCFIVYKYINYIRTSKPRKKVENKTRRKTVPFSAFSSKALKNELAGLLTYPGFWRPSHQLLETGSGFSPTLNGAYSSGTVPDFHRIPFSSLSLRRREPNSAAKVAVFPIRITAFEKKKAHPPQKQKRVPPEREAPVLHYVPHNEERCFFRYLMLGSSRPRCCFLSTTFRMTPRMRAAMPKHASITSGQV